MNKNVLILLLCAFMAAGQATAITLDAEKCVDMAIKASEEVKSARNSTDQARLQQQVARTAYLPDFAGNATVGWMLPDTKMEDMGMTLQMRGIYMAGINLTQPIYAGGKIMSANKMADIGREAASEQLRMSLDKVIANAETSYWTYVAVLSKVEMMKSYMAQIDSAYSRTLTSVNVGMATRNDLLRIDARRSQVAYQLEQVQSGADLCRMALCNTLAIDFDTPIEPVDKDVPVELPSDFGVYNLQDRPEMRLLHADIHLKEQQVKMTRGDYLPSLGLQAGWSAYGNAKLKSMAQTPDGSYVPVSQTINSNGFNIMLGLEIPIFHWGEGIKKVKAAKIDVANARLNLEQNERNLNLEVQQAIKNVTNGRSLLAAARLAMDQAEASLAETTQQYKVGMCTLTEMLDAQSQWHTSKANLIEARTQLRINIVEYRRVTATLSPLQ